MIKLYLEILAVIYLLPGALVTFDVQVCTSSSRDEFERSVERHIDSYLDSIANEDLDFQLELLRQNLDHLNCIKTLYVDPGWVKTKPPQKEFFVQFENEHTNFELVIDLQVDSEANLIEVIRFHE